LALLPLFFIRDSALGEIRSRIKKKTASAHNCGSSRKARAKNLRESALQR
jgi:hypothetical protein